MLCHAASSGQPAADTVLPLLGRYIATCTADGRHTYKEEDLADRVASLLSHMRLIGLGLICVAIASQVPWVLAITYYASELVYSDLT